MAGVIVLFTDFGLEGPYTGQVKTVLHQIAPGVPVIDLFADLPPAKPEPAAYLLAAYGGWFPAGTVILAVVDPGVGGDRAAVVVEADSRWYVGPDNGLLELVTRRADYARSWEISAGPEAISASFHGRDLFAPVAGLLARGDLPAGRLRPTEVSRRPDWPDDLPEIVYIDKIRQRDDGPPGGADPEWGATCRCRAGSRAPAGVLRRPGGRSVLVRELERARRDRRECRTVGCRARPRGGEPGGDPAVIGRGYSQGGGPTILAPGGTLSWRRRCSR